MKQSRLMSLIEAGANVLIGYGINVAANMVVLPAFGFAVTLPDALGIGLAFMAIAFARNYVLRRLFEALRGPAARRGTAAPREAAARDDGDGQAIL